MLHLAFRNLFSNRARNLLTAFSVMIAMMLVTFVIAAQLQTRRMVTMIKGRNNLLVTARVKAMPLSWQKQLEAMPEVKRAMHMLVANAASADKRQKFLLHATTADYTTISDSWFFVPAEGVAQWESEKTGALVGRQTAQDMNLTVGSRLTVDTQLGPLPVTVSGISTRGFKTTGMLVHYDYFAQTFKREGRVSAFWVELNPGADLKAVAKSVDDAFKNTDSPTESYSSAAHLKMSAQAAKVVPSLVTGAGLIILLATLLVTANTIAISIRERIPELATLRAIGFRRGWVLRLLVSEVLIICLMGGLVGAVIPLIVFRGGVEMGSGGLMLGKVELPPTLLGFILALSALLGLAASLFPAWRAARSNVANALRGSA